jgi:hypothetical protein
MAIYTVHEPPLKRYDTATDPDRFVFVRDGFSLWAFLLGPLWMLRHRMWLALIGYIALMAALQFGLHRLELPGEVGPVIAVLVALLVGVEAGTLRRFTLSRRGWNNVGLIVGDDREMAEQRFFDAWVNAAPIPRPLSAASTAGGTAGAGLIGLFPQPGASR